MTDLDIHFLGTGGGRFAMTTQRRRTAGIRIVHGGTQVHVDPGPGALVFSNWAGLGPQSLDGLIVTHCHPDHYGDAEVFIEAMTHGTTKKRGTLATTRSVLWGSDGIGPSISAYHRGLVGEVVELEPGTGFTVNDLSFRATEARHSDPASVGLLMEAPGIGAVGYTGDTGYFPELGTIYRGARLLVLCVMWPRAQRLEKHLSTDEAERILLDARPGCAVITHFGMRMLNAGPEKEAAYLEEATGVPVVAAEDGLKATLGEQIVFQSPRKSDKPRAVEA
ncbi:MAG TPA: MBL fold metallo-hydrolase [Candidatus Desulfaltia sp.]|nr:MBL fold metallo-hydrolase [Candidatus Desulfaltia sp.]